MKISLALTIMLVYIGIIMMTLGGISVNQYIGLISLIIVGAISTIAGIIMTIIIIIRRCN